MPSDDTIRKLIDAGLNAVVCVMPFSFLVMVFKPTAVLLRAKVPLFDCALWIVFVVWLWHTFRGKGFTKVVLPPVPLWAFAAAGACSTLFGGHIVASMKELVQIIDCFVLFPLLFVNRITSRAQIERVILCLGIVSAVVVIYGVVQFAVLAGESYLVRSVFDNRNVLAGFLTMIIPLLLAFRGERYHTSLRVLSSIVVIGGVIIMTAIFPFFALLATLVVTSVLKYRKVWPAAAVAVLFALVAVSPVSVPFSEIRNPEGELTEPRDLSGYHERLRKSVEMTYQTPLVQVGRSPYAILVATSMTIPREIPEAYTRRLIEAHRKDAAFGEGGHIAQRFVEARAALNILTDRPVFGVGIGRYQTEIGRFYENLPKLNTMEPDTQNGYGITLFTMGLVGLACQLWILRHFFGRTRALMSRSRGDPFARDLSVGLFGGLLGFAIVNAFVPILYQSTAPMFVLVLSLSTSMDHEAAVSGAGTPREDGGRV